MLVFGGDEVYPYPTRAEYDMRTETPYKLAFAGRARPDVFAIPGNHDWYDSLVAFSRTFCRPERGFAGCPTRQTRSYFALKLPANWWLLAIDLQLGADLDEPQVQYFQKVAARMDDAARLIFCVPEPRWILEDAYPRHSSYEELSSTRFLEEKVFRRKARVFLTGDLHFYKRHENAEGIQKITSGGGGAFLHPTHAPATKLLRNGFEERAAYPDEKTSAAPDVAEFPVPVHQSEVRLAVRVPLRDVGVAGVGEPRSLGRHRSAHRARRGDERGDPRSAQRHVAGQRRRRVHLLHRHAHALVAHPGRRLSTRCCIWPRRSSVGWGALLLTVQGFDLAYGSMAQLLLSGLVTFVLGGPVGAFILGVYLFVSIRIFGRHGNEAFSSLRIQDFKQWLRLRIDAAGSLTIYAIAIDRVPRRWRAAQRGGETTLEARRRACERAAAHRQG